MREELINGIKVRREGGVRGSMVVWSVEGPPQGTLVLLLNGTGE